MSVEEFQQAVQNFIRVNAESAQALLSSKTEENVVFIGRATCPFCRKFVPKLAAVVKETGARVHYLNSEDAEDIAGITAIRERYGVPTVPGLLFNNQGTVYVKCDSSMPEIEIRRFINK